MKYWFDTEFIEDGVTIDLISIGIVAEDGRMFYAENADCLMERACPWVRENVFPHLEQMKGAYDASQRGILKSRSGIADAILTFIGADPKPEFWAYFGSYDWVCLCQLYGRMINLPKGWPMRVNDIAQFNIRFPEQATTKHHALNDALWTKDAYDWAHSSGRYDVSRWPSLKLGETVA